MSEINLVLFEPEADWKPKLEFPALTGCKQFSLDLETKDPLLEDHGPGSIRKDGYPVGISLATDTGYKRYYPFAHELGGNLPRENVLAFFTDLLKRTDLGMVGAKVAYDLEWLRFLGIRCHCRVGDIQLAEPLLDDEALSYSLNTLANKWLGVRKDEEMLNLAASAYGVDPKLGLWQLHSKFVGAYAEADAALTLAIHNKQLAELHKQSLMDLYNMECELLEIVLDMRLQGVRVDLDEAARLAKELRDEEHKAWTLLRNEVGFAINVNSAAHIAKVCSMRGISHPHTAKGNPSFDKTFLKHADDPLFKQILNIRSLNKLRKDFVEGTILHHHVQGRIHAEFHQLRGDDGGARGGRFASSNPNLQQIPSRDKVVAPKIRRLFIPNDGELWAKLDYSKQEPRLQTHFAYLMKYDGAAKMRQEYMSAKKVDPYAFIQKETGVSYDHAKIISLAITYGEGEDKLARDLGVNRKRASQLLEEFNSKMPFLQKLADRCKRRAEEKGFIMTILGRKQRFDFWEPMYNHKFNKNYETPLRMEAAHAKWNGEKRLVRAYTYKALNRLIQGSAADMTKAAMIKIKRELNMTPVLQVHDELDFSVNSEYEGQQIQFRMENAVEMTVPIFADLYIGKHWK